MKSRAMSQSRRLFAQPCQSEPMQAPQQFQSVACLAQSATVHADRGKKCSASKPNIASTVFFNIFKYKVSLEGRHADEQMISAQKRKPAANCPNAGLEPMVARSRQN
jgi:hypothetical protein